MNLEEYRVLIAQMAAPSYSDKYEDVGDRLSAAISEAEVLAQVAGIKKPIRGERLPCTHSGGCLINSCDNL